MYRINVFSSYLVIISQHLYRIANLLLLQSDLEPGLLQNTDGTLSVFVHCYLVTTLFLFLLFKLIDSIYSRMNSILLGYSTQPRIIVIFCFLYENYAVALKSDEAHRALSYSAIYNPIQSQTRFLDHGLSMTTMWIQCGLLKWDKELKCQQSSTPPLRQIRVAIIVFT